MLPEIVEQWRAIPGWEKYEVSNLGKVRVRAPDGTTRLRKIKQSRDGYVRVAFHESPRHRVAYLHRLVLEAFTGPQPDGCECRHLDGNRGNNCHSNLSWGTRIENNADKLIHGTLHQGGRVYCAKVTDADALAIRHRAAAGEGYLSIARDFNTDRRSIAKIASGDTFASVGGPRTQRCPRKLDGSKVERIRQLYATGLTHAAIAAEFGTSRELIGQVVRGARWT